MRPEMLKVNLSAQTAEQRKDEDKTRVRMRRTRVVGGVMVNQRRSNSGGEHMERPAHNPR